MSGSQHDFVAEHYASRAQDYVASKDHSRGDDLDQIEAMLANSGAARVLDLGCGGGHVSYRAARHVPEVVACDLTPAMLDAVARTAAERGLANIAVQQGAAEHLPFADATFDAVLSRFSTHHWHNMDAGLREARRVLRPAGRALFIDVIAPADALLDTHLQTVELLRDPSHVRDYTAAEWIAALSRAGFAPRGLVRRRMRMHFPVWIARTRTPEEHARAIRSLQQGASEPVRRHFAIAGDGSFSIDTLAVEAEAR